MSEGSLIGWLHQPGYIPLTPNIVLGCKTRSTGCLHCFAPRWVNRQAHYPGRDGIVVKNAEGALEWTGKILTFPERITALLHMRKPRMVFVTALGELFDPQVDEDFLVQLWETMAATPQHIYVILTKLPKRMHDIVLRMVELPRADGEGKIGVLPNVWLGVSIENQEQANIRVPWLMRTPAAIRAVSCEPLLSPMSLTRIPRPSTQQPELVWDVLGKRQGVPGQWQSPLSHGVDWVIIGGESASRAKARPMHPAWARALAREATEAGVATFFKQWGSWGPAPWVVRVCDPDKGWHGTDAELAEAKAKAEAIGATHSLPVWADQYDMLPTDPGHKCWSLERRELPANSPHAPMRYYQGKTAGHEIYPGQILQQWPSVGGQIIESSVNSTAVAVTVPEGNPL